MSNADGASLIVEVHLEERPARGSVKPEREENWWDYCPICSTKLVSQKCKFICPHPQCHFFMSCSEFDL